MLQTILRPFRKPKIDIKDRPNADHIYRLLKKRDRHLAESYDEIYVDRGTASVEEKFNYLMVKLEYPIVYPGEIDPKSIGNCGFYPDKQDMRYSRRVFEFSFSPDDDTRQRQWGELDAAYKKYVSNGFYVPGEKRYEIEEILSRSRRVSLSDKMKSLYGFYFP